MDEQELEQLEILLGKFNHAFHKEYPISCENVETVIHTTRVVKSQLYP